ncbi:MAG TPA: hypothetical protein VNJ54_11405 [Plantibacter sp.]|uniref:hypothetical protein n=1 Tax=Plantibacter sp. TaxID=1871045 RepID=UPI002B8FCE05|nr:hypothetical protein [Plantibacter sp.]
MSDIPQGEAGEPGKPGSPPPDSKGGDGGAGGVGRPGVPGLPGIAGRRGLAGRAGRDGHNSISLISNGVSRLWAIAATLFLAVVILALAVTLTSQARDKRTIDALRDRITGLNDQIADLNDKADFIRVDRVNEQIIEDCRNLYLEDITFARITRDIEEGQLFSTFAFIPLDTPPDERLAIQQQAVDDLTVKDIGLIEAMAAFRRYIDLDPLPLDCPHPDSK